MGRVATEQRIVYNASIKLNLDSQFVPILTGHDKTLLIKSSDDMIIKSTLNFNVDLAIETDHNFSCNCDITAKSINIRCNQFFNYGKMSAKE